jgi:hypothetical protein
MQRNAIGLFAALILTVSCSTTRCPEGFLATDNAAWNQYLDEPVAIHVDDINLLDLFTRTPPFQDLNSIVNLSLAPGDPLCTAVDERIPKIRVTYHIDRITRRALLLRIAKEHGLNLNWHMYQGAPQAVVVTPKDGLTLTVPSRFKVEKGETEAPAGDMVVSRWRSSSGEVLELMAWPNGPAVDRGPMIVATEEPLQVAGQPTKLIKTKVFFGSTEEVLVIHLRQGETRYLISAKGMKAEDFKSVLRSVRLERK